ncbi:hypothetical protein Cgig2_020650 [Carnegiea gigantea]|uniref:Uncharacterized protein n=1 Tax=Carnegiea gigantea TaxID=171969 RepID=A0A9Q1JFD5_9CARY|nr:hypothetical protein Cgig2_020650 [Carnegiea gigantea]
MPMPPTKVNPFAHNLSLGYEPSLQKLHFKIREEKLKKHLQDKGIYTYDIPPYLLTLNGGFIKEGEDAPYYRFTKSKYILKLGESKKRKHEDHGQVLAVASLGVNPKEIITKEIKRNYTSMLLTINIEKKRVKHTIGELKSLTTEPNKIFNYKQN